MDVYEVSAIDTLMSNMDQGIIFINRDRKIQNCNQRAKEITGIVTDAPIGHPAGRIEEGDIVILADNKLGEDDGDLGPEELGTLGIADPAILQGDMLIAAGVYRNEKIEPVYKHMREHLLDVPMQLNTDFCGFPISASIDERNRETAITVGGRTYRLDYYASVGNMVVLDRLHGDVKFCQIKGYSVRNEDAGNLLRGHPFQAKSVERVDVDVRDIPFLDLFDESDLAHKLFDVLDGRTPKVVNHLYDLNRRPFVCNIIPWQREGEDRPAGVFLLIRDAEQLSDLLADRNEILRQMEERQTLRMTGVRDYPEEAFEDFVGKSNEISEVKYMAYKASRNRFNVIITGESGTGKSQLARDIHRLGNPRAPFVEVNCNAIAPSLFESELFGYVGGAFTGAKSEGKVGFFEAANKGTIFLDEIGEIPLDIQVKLLHVLQDKTIYRVGSSKPIHVDVRVIAATNKDLEAEVAAGRFRQDLYYRISVFPIEIPPLRQRKADLYLLINRILQRVCEQYGMELKQFSGGALQRMMAYGWPGNVRELENIIERAVTLCDGNVIYPEHLRIGAEEAPRTMKELLEAEEQRILQDTLARFGGDKRQAMEELGLSRTVFYDKLKKYGLPG